MGEVTVLQMPAFKRAYKKLHTNQKTEVNQTIKTIINHPARGEEKKVIFLALLSTNLVALISSPY